MPDRADANERMVPLFAAAGPQRGRGRRSGRAAGVPTAAVPLRPRGVGAILDTGIEVLRARFLVCVGTCVLLWLPVRSTYPLFGAHKFMAAGGPGQASVLIWGVVTGVLLPVLIQTLGAAFVTLIVYGHMLGRAVSFGEALRVSAGKLFAMLLVAFLTGMVVAGAMIVLGLPGLLCPPFLLAALALGLYATWKLWIAPAALMLEPSPGRARYARRPPRGALERLLVWSMITLEDVGQAFFRSFRLNRASFLRWLGVWAGQALIVLMFQAVSSAGDQPQLRSAVLEAWPVDTRLFDTVHVLTSSLFLGLVTAFSAVVITVFYLDARIRTEGLDLRMRLERLRMAHAGTAPELAR